jgi:hypothetical protein
MACPHGMTSEAWCDDCINSTKEQIKTNLNGVLAESIPRKSAVYSNGGIGKVFRAIVTGACSRCGFVIKKDDQVFPGGICSSCFTNKGGRVVED